LVDGDAKATQSQRSAKSLRLHQLNDFPNFICTPRTLVGVLVTTGLVGKDAHELHAAAARRTSRTPKGSWRLTGDRSHTQPNKQTEAQTTATATEALTGIKFRNAADKRKDQDLYVRIGADSEVLRFNRNLEGS
jgi:hypothetical protein